MLFLLVWLTVDSCDLDLSQNPVTPQLLLNSCCISCAQQCWGLASSQLWSQKFETVFFLTKFRKLNSWPLLKFWRCKWRDAQSSPPLLLVTTAADRCAPWNAAVFYIPLCPSSSFSFSQQLNNAQLLAHTTPLAVGLGGKSEKGKTCVKICKV